MLGNNITAAFVQPVQQMARALSDIGQALNELGRQANVSNQLKWLEMRQHKGTGSFAKSDEALLSKVGTKVSAGIREQRR